MKKSSGPLCKCNFKSLEESATKSDRNCVRCLMYFPFEVDLHCDV